MVIRPEDTLSAYKIRGTRLSMPTCCYVTYLSNTLSQVSKLNVLCNAFESGRIAHVSSEIFILKVCQNHSFFRFAKIFKLLPVELCTDTKVAMIF